MHNTPQTSPLFTLIRLLARQAVREHLQARGQSPGGATADRSNRPVQIPARSR